ncbi:hypothetical protein ADJ76_06245 [Schaalia meyeri]|nr:hypothetical protein ADJ76_06245 [Schaalia meyeri]
MQQPFHAPRIIAGSVQSVGSGASTPSTLPQHGHRHANRAALSASSGSGARSMPAVIAQRAPAWSMMVSAGTKATERAGARNAKDAKRTGERISCARR